MAYNVIDGTNASETIIGTAGDDFIRARAGADVIDGLEGNDQLEGGAGDDILIGNLGNDRLIGGMGNDRLTGDAGADEFRFQGYDIVSAARPAPVHEIDTITDLNFAEGDLIVLSHFAAGTFKGTNLYRQLDLVDTTEGPGSGANIRNWAGLVDLVRSSDAVDARRDGSSDTLLLVVSTPEGSTQTIAVLNGWHEYAARTNHAPTAVADTVAVAEDATAAGNVLANDSDVDAGDVLRVTALGGEAIAAGGAHAMAGAYGVLTLNADGGYTYTPANAAAQALAAGASATDSFTYTITDAAGATATTTLTFAITGTNDAPVAKALAGTVSENGAALVLTPDFTDADAGDSHAITVDTTGTLGHVVLNADGTFAYDANGKFESLKAGATTTDSFTYTVTDASGAASTKTVTMTIVGENDGPVAKALSGTVGENGAALVLTPDFTDADAGDSHAITVDTTGTLGHVVLNADGAFAYDANGKFESLKAGATATDSFTYTVTDASGAASTKTVTMTIVGENDGPVAKAISGTVSESGTKTLKADFTDADLGDSFSFATDTTGTKGKVTTGADGSFVYDTNGRFGYLKGGQTATDSFTYTVTDASGASATKTATVTIVGDNAGPVALADHNGVNQKTTLTVKAAKGVLANDSDADGDTLAVTAVNGAAGSVGKALAGAYGALTLQADGGYTYVANGKAGSLPARQVAQDHFSYTVGDGHGGTTVQTLTITVEKAGQGYIRGGEGCDLLLSIFGCDVLDGGNGDDLIYGGLGSDVLIGGAGNDLMYGGWGCDTFVFNKGFGRDTILDFTNGVDVLQFSKALFADFAAVKAASYMIGNDLVISTGNGDAITLSGFRMAQFDASDVLIV